MGRGGPSSASGRQRNRLRIVAGRWRGRVLAFPDAPGLRPTGDRVRETLFNWLGTAVRQAHCLDLFAGSGALGLEAASRGAASVLLVERSAAVARALEHNLAQLAVGDTARVLRADALALLQRPPPRPMDCVFLDPPFQSDILSSVFALLEGGGWLAPEAFIYLETDRHHPPPAWPENWELRREATAGNVVFRLLRRVGSDTTGE